MTSITEQVVRELAGYKGVEAPVTSCYLDVDGRRYLHHHDYERALDHLVKTTRAQLNGDTSPSVAEDFQRIEQFVRGGIDRSRTRGLAMFSCSAEGFWKVVELPVSVANQMVVNHTPYVRQLERIVGSAARFGVLLADRQRARMLVFELGQIVERDELFEQLPRHEDDGGTWDKDHVRNHAEAIATQHLKHAAQVALHVFQEQTFDHLAVAAPEDIGKQLERFLHPYLRDRLVTRLSIPTSASEEEVRQAMIAVEAAVERQQQAELVERLRDAVGGGKQGVAGLEAVLRSVVERRVDTLLVSRGFVREGWRCGQCGDLAVVGRICKACGAEMEPVADVVEAAIEEALGQSCRVVICDGNADLDVLGQTGALLRF